MHTDYFMVLKGLLEAKFLATELALKLFLLVMDQAYVHTHVALGAEVFVAEWASVFTLCTLQHTTCTKPNQLMSHLKAACRICAQAEIAMAQNFHVKSVGSNLGLTCKRPIPEISSPE